MNIVSNIFSVVIQIVALQPLIIGMVYFLCCPSFAVKEYYSLTKSVRALGMGGAFYGFSDDEYALFYNPAGLSLYRGGNEFFVNLMNGHLSSNAVSSVKTIIDVSSGKSGSSNISNLVTQLQTIQGNVVHGGMGLFPVFHKNRFGLGILLADTKVNFAFLGREFDTSLDLTLISDSGLVVGYARPIPKLEALHVGLNLKGVFRAGGRKAFSLEDIAKSSALNLDPDKLGGLGFGVDFDLGAIYEFPEPPIGVVTRASLVLNNLIASKFTMARVGGNPPGLVRMVTLAGMTAFPGWGVIDNVVVLLDLAEFSLGGESDPHYGARSGSLWKHLNFGTELPMFGGWFRFRTGFYQGSPTAGLGLHFKLLRLDLATHAEELAEGVDRLTSRRYDIRLALGGGSSAQPILAPPPAKVPVEPQPEVEEKKPESTLPSEPGVLPKNELKQDLAPKKKEVETKAKEEIKAVDPTKRKPNEEPVSEPMN